MASSKTFASGAVLTAADLNTYVNPSTAAHIPYAVAAGSVTAAIPAAAADGTVVTVALPAGRFTVAPTVVPGVVASGGVWATVVTVTTTNFTVRLHAAAALPSGYSATITWTATQMTTTTAAG